jgi:hypothetical protein
MKTGHLSDSNPANMDGNQPAPVGYWSLSIQKGPLAIGKTDHSGQEAFAGCLGDVGNFAPARIPPLQA